MYTILSIDGGGIRGIIPGQIMVTLEAKLQKRVDQSPELKAHYPDPVRLSDFFDFFAGTSTGGILTSLYLCPGPTGRPRFSAQDAVDLYLEHGDDIFEISVWKQLASGDGVLDEKHDATQLERLLKRYLGNTKLSELLKPCLITAYDIRKRRTHFFNQVDAADPNKGNSYDFLVRDVCRATSAAPTYFETPLIHSLEDVTYPLIDGGVFANNPALCAYSEVRNMYPRLTAKDMLIVSLGTGSENEPYSYNVARNWGSIGWVRPVIDIMMSGAAEVTNYHLTKMYEAVKHEDQYIRIQPADLGDAEMEMDNAKPRNLKALLEVGKTTASTCGKQLDKLADVLIHRNEEALN